MTNPDDLPRSPSGRIPQWVRDEAAGRSVDQPAWRSSGPPLGTQVRVGSRRGSAPRRSRALRGAGRVRRSDARRENRATTVIAVLVVLTALAGSARWAAGQPGGLAGAWEAISGRQGAAAASAPPAGDGEQDEPLGRPAEVVRPSAAYAFVDQQRGPGVEPGPVTWSPCRTIHYVVNTARAPERFVPDVAAVVAELSVATGLRFTFDGLTDEAPTSRRAAYQPDRYGKHWAPVLVQLATADEVPGLAGQVAGLGGSTGVADPTTGVISYVSGAARIDVTMLSEPAVDGEPAYVTVLRHELGHVLGLQHVADPTQIMNPETTPGVRDYQDGDRTGLAQLGGGACAPGI